MKTTTIQKWGNSYAVRIPKEVVTRMRLTEGQEVAVSTARNGKSLSLVPSFKTQSLKEMLKHVTPETMHEETDWGRAVGKEVW